MFLYLVITSGLHTYKLTSTISMHRSFLTLHYVAIQLLRLIQILTIHISEVWCTYLRAP